MRIPADLIFIWPSTVGTIPSLWARETTLDGLYPKAWGTVTPNNTGGAANHTHTSPVHSHAISVHTHTYNIDNAANETSDDRTNDDSGGSNLSGTQHNHGANTSGAANGNTSSDALTYGSMSNDPPFYQLIFIKATSGAYFENDIIGLWAGFESVVTIPASWQECTGAGGSPDLRNKYLKGAAGGADAGTTGGATANTHDITHNHASGSHSHDAATTNTPSYSGAFRSGHSAGSGGANYVHTHQGSLASVATTVNQNTDTLSPSEVVEPGYKKVCAIQMKAGAVVVRGLIGAWLGAIDEPSLPRGWVLCDGNNGAPDLRDKYIKIAASNAEIGNTGGANSHTHAAQAHSHTSASHNHTGSTGGANEQVHSNASSSHGYTKGSDTHTVSSISSTTPSWQNANTTADSASNEPQYRTVAYLMLKTIYARKALLML